MLSSLQDSDFAEPPRRCKCEACKSKIATLSRLAPNEIGVAYQVHLDNPNFNPNVPIYAGNLSVAESYKTYDPKKYNEKSRSWAIDFIDSLANFEFQKTAQGLRNVRTPFEAEIHNDQKAFEENAPKLYKKKPIAAQEYLTKYFNLDNSKNNNSCLDRFFWKTLF